MFARIFYRDLVDLSRAAPRVDVGALVHGCRAAIARIERGQASALLQPIAAGITDRIARAQLESALGELRDGPATPFDHPYHWAAFTFFGCETIELDWDGLCRGGDLVYGGRP